MNRTANLYALTSVALFGISTPAAKSLVGAVGPIMFAGIFYCGAGIGLAFLRRLARATRTQNAREQSLPETSLGLQGRLPLVGSQVPFR